MAGLVLLPLVPASWEWWVCATWDLNKLTLIQTDKILAWCPGPLPPALPGRCVAALCSAQLKASQKFVLLTC